MARLVLKLEDSVLQDHTFTGTTITIGRLPANDIHIDDLAVSGHHAKLVLEGEHYVVYDENSTNGTYVNGEKVNHAVLHNQDSVLIGRHLLLFEETPAAPAPGKPVVNPTAVPPTGANPAPVRITSALDKKTTGIIKVMSGKTDQAEYVLAEDSVVIGRSETANIRLTRWFAPKVATTIHHRGGRYYVGESETPTPVRVNSEVVAGERLLEPGDTILVDDVTLVFDVHQ